MDRKSYFKILIGMYIVSFFLPLIAKTEMLSISQQTVNRKEERNILKSKKFPATNPRNIIFMIADGASSSHYLAARYHFYGINGRLNLETIPHVALMTTHSADNAIITDSAASATALSTGHKTKNGYVGISKTGNSYKHLIEKLMEHGYQTALVTTGKIAGATPAGFSAHNISRLNKAEIAQDYLKQNISILVGGGEDITEGPYSVVTEAHQKNYFVIQNKIDRNIVSTPLLMLFEGLDSISKNPKAPLLKVLTNEALSLLKKSKNGFFAMIEEDGTDSFSHDNQIEPMVEQLKNFDDAVQVAINFVLENPETLLIVTSDHESGGLTFIEGDQSKNQMTFHWSTEEHTGAYVPLFAFGPHAENFYGMIDNSDVPKILEKLLIKK